MLVTWDEPKRITNLENRGLDFADLDYQFFLSTRIEPAKAGRLKAVGKFRGMTLAVISRPLGSEAFP